MRCRRGRTEASLGGAAGAAEATAIATLASNNLARLPVIHNSPAQLRSISTAGTRSPEDLRLAISGIDVLREDCADKNQSEQEGEESPGHCECVEG